MVHAVRRFASQLLLLARTACWCIALGLLWSAPSMAANDDFCWKDSYGRGVGTVPQACPSGQERIGLLCYPRCGPGTTRVGTDCHSVCPPGLRDDGLFCRAAEYGRGAGYPWKFGDPLNDSGMLARCAADGNPQGCEMSGAVAYPKCQPGYRAVGCCICRPEVPNCAALGLAGGVDLSCAKKVIVGDPQIGTCAAGQQPDAGLCYAGCRQAYNGVGPVCWGQCPASHPFSCAAGCAKTEAACAQNTTDQVLSVLEVVANVGLAVATAGGSTAATAGAKAAATATKVAVKGGSRFAARITRQEAVAIIRKQAKEAGKDLPESAVQTYADAVVQAGTTGEFDPEVLAGLDPTGIAGIVVAYAKPVCSAPIQASSPPATRVGQAIRLAALPPAPSPAAATTATAATTSAAAPPASPGAAGSTVTLLGANGKFVVAEPNGSAMADRTAAGPWERFGMLTHPDGTVSFKSAHGKFLSAAADGRVSAAAASPGPSERYTPIRQAAGVLLLKSVHGKYLSAEPDGRLTASRVQAGAAQTFKVQ